MTHLLVPSPTVHGDTTMTADLQSWCRRGRLVVADPDALAPAAQIARRHLAAVERAACRAASGAEVHRLPSADGHPLAVSPLLARLIRAALRTASGTGGLVDPTVRTPRHPDQPGHPARGWLPACGHPQTPARLAAAARPTWRDVRLEGCRVTVPGGCALDLRVSALANALDDIAAVATRLTGVDVLVQLGGRAARPGHGWAVCDPAAVVDPRTGAPAPRVWQQIEVDADDCRTASAHAVAAAVLGADAPDWLLARGARARLVAHDGSVLQVDAPHPAAARAA